MGNRLVDILLTILGHQGRGSTVSQPISVAYRKCLTSRLPQRLILLAIVDLSSEALLSTTAFASVGIHE